MLLRKTVSCSIIFEHILDLRSNLICSTLIFQFYFPLHLTWKLFMGPHSHQKQISCISFAGYGENHLQ